VPPKENELLSLHRPTMSREGWQPLCILTPHIASVNRTTHSDVVSLTITVKPKAEGSERPSRFAGIPHTAPSAALPSSLPHAKRCEILIRERDDFMRTLASERTARKRAEDYASTKIQVRCHPMRPSLCRCSGRVPPFRPPFVFGMNVLCLGL
jgi:hypothetical protein